MSTILKVSLAAAALVGPILANLTVGGSLGLWWAPFPLWAFALLAKGCPRWLVLLVPPLLFAGAAALVIRASLQKSRFVVMFMLVSGVVVQLFWGLAFTREGLLHVGSPFVILVNALAYLLLVASAVCLRRSWNTSAPAYRTAATWLVCLWFSWLATPWMFEAI
jgi:hypothetical protein